MSVSFEYSAFAVYGYGLDAPHKVVIHFRGLPFTVGIYEPSDLCDFLNYLILVDDFTQEKIITPEVEEWVDVKKVTPPMIRSIPLKNRFSVLKNYFIPDRKDKPFTGFVQAVYSKPQVPVMIEDEFDVDYSDYEAPRVHTPRPFRSIRSYASWLLRQGQKLLTYWSEYKLRDMHISLEMVPLKSYEQQGLGDQLLGLRDVITPDNVALYRDFTNRVDNGKLLPPEVKEIGCTLSETNNIVKNLTKRLDEGNLMPPELSILLSKLGETNAIVKEILARYDDALKINPDTSLAKGVSELAKEGIKHRVDSSVCISAVEGIIVVLGFIFLCMQAKKISTILVLIATLSAAGGLLSRLAKWIEINKDDCLKIIELKGDKDYQSQSLEIGALVEPMARLISTGVATVMTHGDPRPLPKFIKIGQYASSFYSLTKMSEVVSKSIDVSRKILWEMGTGLPFEMEELDEFAIELEEWFLTLNETVMNAEWLRKLPANANALVELNTLRDLGLDFQKRLANASSEIKKNVSFRISEAMRLIVKNIEILSSLNTPSAFKAEPVSLVLVGSTGLGKTTIVKQMAIDLVRHMPIEIRRKINKDNLIFSKSKTTQYFDGYNGQFLTFIDEIFKSCEEKEVLEEINSIFEFINTFGAPLDMANLNSKGKVTFSSKFCVFTTNLDNWAHFQGTVIRNTAALLRRRDFVVEPVIKSNFVKNGQLDGEAWKKYARDNKLNPAKPDYAQFRLHDPCDHSKILKTVDYDTLISIMVSKYESKTSTFDELEQHREKAFEQAILGLDYQVQGAETLEFLKQIRENAKSRSYAALKEIPISLVLNLVETQDIYTETVDIDVVKANESDLIGELLDEWLSLPNVEKCEFYILVTALSASRNASLQKTLCARYLKTLSRCDMKELNSNLLVKIIKDVKLPQLDWRFKIKSYFVSVRENFPYKHAIVLLGGLAIIASMLGLMVYSYKTDNKPIIKYVREVPDKLESKVIIPERLESKPYSKSKSKVRAKFRKADKMESEDVEVDILNGLNFELKTQVEGDVINKHYEQQALADEQWETQLVNVAKNVVSAEFVDNNGTVISRTKGLLVCSDCFIIPRHLIKNNVEKNLCAFRLIGSTNRYNIGFKECKFVEIGNRWQFDDVVVVKVPDHKISARNIIHLFLTQNEILDVSDTWGELLIPDNNYMVRHATFIQAQEKFLGSNKDVNPEIATDLSATVGWQYTAATKNGDCGSPLIRWDSRSRTKIMGIHSAGNTSSTKNIGCFAAIVDQEFVTDAVRKLKSVNYRCESDDLEPSVCDDTNLFTKGMDILGYVPQEKQVNLPISESKIVPSLFQGSIDWSPKTKPVKMSARGPGSALSKSLSKFKTELPLVDTNLVYRITKAFIYKYNFMYNKKATIYDINDALNSIGELNSINMTSSMGYPWVLNRTRKHDVIEYNEEEQKFDLISDSFIETINNHIDSMENGTIPEFIWLCYLKDERRPIDKVDNNKVRLFHSCPFDLTVLCRMYFGHFMDYIHKGFLKHGVCIGINPHSSEWHALALRLLTYSDKFLATDYVGWDVSLAPDFVQIFFRLADSYYGDKGSKVRGALEHIIMNPKFQVMFFRFMVGSCNPSGCPMTAEINSFANLVIIVYVLHKLGFSLEYILENYFAAVYGDDKVLAFRADFEISKYKQQLNLIGLDITSAQKTSDIVFETLDQIEFLKRSFKLIDQTYVGSLKLDVIKESVLWVRGTYNQALALEDTVRSAFEELKLYPIDEVFEIYIEIMRCCLKYDVNFPLSDHFLEHKLEDYSGTLLQSLLLSLGGLVWNLSLSYEKNIVSVGFINSLPDNIRVNLAMIDLGKRFPTLPDNTFVHVGFRSDSWEGELCFSDNGVVLVPCKYESEVSKTYFIKKKTLLDNIRFGKYHSVLNNCIVWVEKVLSENMLQFFPYHQNLLNYCSVYMVDYIQQGDEEIVSKGLASEVVATEQVESSLAESGRMIGCFTGSEGPPRNIPQLLGTETMLDQVQWGEQARDHTLLQIDFPEALFKVLQFQYKINFNTLFMADLRIRIKLSSTQFQCGQLLAVWYPLFRQGVPQGVDPHVISMTNMYHTLLSAGSSNEVTMSIPFTHTQNYINPMSNYDMGTLFVKVFNPLNAISPKFARVVVLANFENVRVIIPTPDAYNVKSHGNPSAVYPKYLVQGDEVTEKSSEGIVSGPVTAVSSVVRLFGRIPVFSSAATMVSTALDTVSGVAKYMGLSKPTTLESTRPIIPRPFTGVCYSDGLDAGVVLGSSVKNHVAIQPSLFGSLVDELNIEYITKTPGVVLITPWEDTHKVDVQIFNIPVIPTLTFSNSANSYETYPNCCAFLSNMFTYWRGSLQFRIKVVSTTFHKGILVIGYIPYGSTRDKIVLETTSHIKLDIGETNTVDFTVPFVSNRMYNKIPSPEQLIGLQDTFATGTLVAYVLNPLVAPATVAKKVEINVWMSAAQDLELAVPTLENISKFRYSEEKLDLTDYILEGKSEIEIRDRTRAEWQLGAKASSLNMIDSCDQDIYQLVMGDNIVSLRDILKISQRKIRTSVVVPPFSTMAMFVPMIDFINDQLPNHLYDTYFDHIMRIFRYSRGSLRHKLCFKSGNFKVSVSLVIHLEAVPYTWTDITFLNEGTFWCMAMANLNPTLEYTVPFYSDTKNVITGHKEFKRSVKIMIENLGGDTIETGLVVYESIGDDFSAGYLIAPPPVYLRQEQEFDLADELYNIQLHAESVTKVDGTYDFKLNKSVGNAKIKSNPIDGQLWYYSQYMKQHALYIAEGGNNVKLDNLYQTIGVSKRSYNWYICFISYSDWAYDKGSISVNYDEPRKLGQGAWYNIFVQNGTALVRLVSGEKAQFTSVRVSDNFGFVQKFVTQAVKNKVTFDGSLHLNF